MVRDLLDRALAYGPRRIRNASLALLTVAALAFAGGSGVTATPSTDECARGSGADVRRALGLDPSPPGVTLADLAAEREQLCETPAAPQQAEAAS